MPKISKTTASSHYDFPGSMESFESAAGQWNVTFERYGVDPDLAPLFKGAQDDLCHATQLGYVIAAGSGCVSRMAVRRSSRRGTPSSSNRGTSQ